MNSNPKISVIIPAFNSFKDLPNAIGSILNQTFKDFELIIVDDGSKDDTENLIKQYESDKRIVYIKQDNRGISNARNAGIMLAKTDYISFLDADDTYVSNSLELRIKAFALFNDAEMVIGRYKTLKTNNNNRLSRNLIREYPRSAISKKENMYLCDSKQFFRTAIKKGPYAHTNAISIRKDILIKVGMFDERLPISQDLDLWNRLFFATNRFVFINEIVSNYNYILSGHIKSDVLNLFYDERRRYLKLIKQLHCSSYDKVQIRTVKKRICSKKYKVKAILSYRKGCNHTALVYFLKSMFIYKLDKELLSLIFKALVPAWFIRLFKRIFYGKKSFNFNTY